MLPQPAGSDRLALLNAAPLSTIAFRVEDESQVGEVRRFAVRLGAKMGFDEARCSDAAIIATELATNLLKHAGHGDILIRELHAPSVSGIELISQDHGPGIADIDACMEDGFSTTGTAGSGLGAVRRLSSDFDLYSDTGGTVVLSRISSRSDPPAPSDFGAVSVALEGEIANGDGWFATDVEGRRLYAMIDGIGHGLLASHASQRAIEVVRENATRSLEEILRTMHLALKSTRGAVAGLALIDASRGKIGYAGIGNIGATLWTPSGSKTFANFDGTIGHSVRSVRSYELDLPDSALFVMHSDGILARSRAEEWRGFFRYHPSIVAGLIYGRFRRPADDASLLVHRHRRETGHA